MGHFSCGQSWGPLDICASLLPLQLPLPLVELMENEALKILTEALQSEPFAQLPQEILGDFAGLGPLGVGFQGISALSDFLTTQKYSRSPPHQKSWRIEHRDPVGEIMG